MLSKGFVFLALVGLAAAYSSAAHRKVFWLDGNELETYGVAVNYLQDCSKKWPTPFLIKNYEVAFEGHSTYYFLPKRLPQDVGAMEHDSSLGPSIRVKVDPQKLTVLSAVNE